MKAILAEKPSVAHEIARIVGASEKRDGYFYSSEFLVTWAFGHLVQLALPEDYGIKGFSRESLPIIPDSFLLTSRKVKASKGYIADDSSLRQLRIIGEVFEKCSSIIIATDAGREGEVIFRYIYEYLNCDKPFERLWISSLTDKAIIAGLHNLRPGTDFDGLYFAGRERSQADWLIGLNATQALTVSAGDGLYSLGRVQTPTLSIICRRYLDHKAFQVSNYFQVEMYHQKDGVTFKSLSVDKWDNQQKAESVVRSIIRAEHAMVVSVEKRSETLLSPLLFDLTGLQKEANKKLGLSAEKTLDIAQNLYEKKLISYPRTGSKYISEDIWPEIPNLINALGGVKNLKEKVEKVKWERYNKQIVNDLKVTDHHGILITENIPGKLPTIENAIYEMIACRLLEAVSPPCFREITIAQLNAIHYDFVVKGVNITSAGWKLISGDFEQESEDLNTNLPDLEKGMHVKITRLAVLSKKTKPPALYTEAELLSAMEHAGNSVENAEERKVLKNLGIGTPATRASIIETLLGRDYIARDKKAIVPTEKGLQVYHVVKDKIISDVALTAQWELAFEKIQNKQLDPMEFHGEVARFTKEITAELLTEKSMHRQEKLLCPRCKNSVYLREKVVKCSNTECEWILFRKICGVHLNYQVIEDLLTENRSSLIRGMTSHKGTSFDAYLILSEEGSIAFEFEKKKKRKFR